MNDLPLSHRSGVGLLLVFACALAGPAARALEEGPADEDVRAAVTRGLAVLRSGTAGFSEKRECFTCHNQTLPMLAQVTARDHGFPIDAELLREQARFTHQSFQSRLGRMREGRSIGGRAMTVGYALWALDLADWKKDETTSAMTSFLIKTQEDDGRFFTNPSRPPLEDSPATSSTLAAYYLQRYATPEQKEEAVPTIERARQWLLGYKPVRQEDANSRLWGLSLLGAEEEVMQAARDAVLAGQRHDGGWPQLPDMESDSYATGQALWMLQEAGFPTDETAYRRGLRYLLGTQQEDGSWLVMTRSKPIQDHFESGFPHGKDQFISICGTSWAVAALAAACAPPDPNTP